DRQTDGADFFDGRIHEREDDIDVVDHQVEDDVDVERARGEDAEAVDLEEHRVIEQRNRSANGGVEALEVPDHADAVVPDGERDDLVGLGESGGDGFFDQDIDAGFHQLAGN